MADFFARRFPAALYRTRRWWLTTMLVSYAVAAVMIWWLLQHPQVEQSLLDPKQINQLVNSDFENYYSESAASHFAAQVWTNNAWVAAICIAFGVLGAAGDLRAVAEPAQPRAGRVDHDPSRPRRACSSG